MVITMSDIVTFNTELQAQIAKLLSEGVEPMEVSRICSCSNEQVYAVKNSAQFMKYCYGNAINRLVTVGASVAVDTLIEIARDKKAGKQARVSASDKLLSHTGYHVTESGMLVKEPSNMSQEELTQRLAVLQREASNRATIPVIIEGHVVQDVSDDLANLLK